MKLGPVRVANGSEMIITGFIVLPVCIKGTVFLTPLYITRNLSTNIILGSKCLNDNRANIDCGYRRLGLQIQSQIRVIEKQEIPPKSQSVVCAKLSNKFPYQTVGLCQGRRRVTALGILVANTASEVIDNKGNINLLVMNITDEPIILYFRNKLGIFTLFDYNSIQPFTTLESNVINNVNTPSVVELNQLDNIDDPVVKEILSQVNLNTDHMSPPEIVQIKQLLAQYKDIFQTSNSPRGQYSGIKHEIHTGNHPPMRSRPYRNSPHMQAEIRRHVQDMLQQGVIRESTSCWSFPVCIVPKVGTNEYRCAIDYRKLNQITARDNFPLPNINDTLDCLGSAKPTYFTTLDLDFGYWQIEVEENSKANTFFYHTRWSL